MGSDKKFDLDGYSVDENNNVETDGSVTADGGFVGDVTGDLTGVSGSGVGNYDSAGAINPDISVCVIETGASAYTLTLADGTVAGQTMIVKDIGGGAEAVTIDADALSFSVASGQYGILYVDTDLSWALAFGTITVL